MYLPTRIAAVAAIGAAAAVTAPVGAVVITQISPSSYFYVGTLPTSGSTIDESVTFTGLPVGGSFALSLGGSATADFSNIAATFNTLTPLTISINNAGPNSSFSAQGLNGLIGASNILHITGLLGNITGTTTQGTGTYSGTLTFSPTAAVPEASMWVMMTLGFGVLGYALRRRRVDFALA